MYLLHVKPWQSSKWEPPQGEDLISADRLTLTRGARGITKKNEAGIGDTSQIENRPGQEDLPEVPIVSGDRNEMGAGARRKSYVR